MAALASMTGTRHAAPGEFTRRALDNGKLTLTQVWYAFVRDGCAWMCVDHRWACHGVKVEGLADVLASETAAQLQAAGRAASGEVRRMDPAHACGVYV